MAVLREYFTSFLSKVYAFLCSVLPRSPFQAYLRGYDKTNFGLLRAVNYFVPIPTMLAITYAWVTAMVLFYLYHALVKKIFDGSDTKKAAFLKNLFGKITTFLGKIVGKL